MQSSIPGAEQVSRRVGQGGRFDRITLLERLRELEPDIKAGLFPAWAYHDDELYQLEQEKIFSRSWLYVGHESELKNPGDYVVRYLGADPFVFVRGDDGVSRVLLNVCRHRGARFCWDEQGSAARFTCPYHGWSYRNDGALVGVPFRNEGYPELDLAKWSLLSAPRVERYRGLVFANLDQSAPPLDDYLGDLRWYLDIELGLTASGMEVVGVPFRWLTNVDWKIAQENTAGDSTHTAFTHKSIIDIGLLEGAGASYEKSDSAHIVTAEGHAVSVTRRPAGSEYFFGYRPAIRRLIRQGDLNDAQFDQAKRAVYHHGSLFPNFSFNHTRLRDDVQEDEIAFLMLRVYRPTGPGEMEVIGWVLVPSDAPEDEKQKCFGAAMSSFGPSGSFVQDDIAVWSSVSAASKSAFLRDDKVLLNFQMGSEALGAPDGELPWDDPGTAYSQMGESALRALHDQWLEALLR